MSAAVFSPRATLSAISRGGKSNATVLSEYAQKLFSAAYAKDPAGAGHPDHYKARYTYSADNGDPRTSTHSFTCTVTFFTTPSKRCATVEGLAAHNKQDAEHNAAAAALAHIEKLPDTLLTAPPAAVSSSSSSIRTQSTRNTLTDNVCRSVARTTAPFSIQIYRTAKNSNVCVAVRNGADTSAITNAPSGTSADAMLDAIRQVLDAGFPTPQQQAVPPTLDDELLALFDGDAEPHPPRK